MNPDASAQGSNDEADRRCCNDEADRPTWQRPTLTLLGDLSAETLAAQVSNSDSGGSGTLFGDSGTIL
jgi:hypothetical protein